MFSSCTRASWQVAISSTHRASRIVPINRLRSSPTALDQLYIPFLFLYLYLYLYLYLHLYLYLYLYLYLNLYLHLALCLQFTD